MESGKRLLEYVYPRRVKQRIIFNRGESATLNGFEAMWKTDCDAGGGDLTEPSLLFAKDAFIRNEYVEIYDLIRKSFAESVDAERRTVALVRGSSGVGKSAFLQYLVARISNEAKNILIVRGDSDNSMNRSFLHLSTNWLGWKIATKITSRERAKDIEEYCDWTIVDGCDWEPTSNFVVGAAAPSTPWKGFKLVESLVQICMPPWSIQQLVHCRDSINRYGKDESTLHENYKLVGGIARWALTRTTSVVNNVDSAVQGIDFTVVQHVMATQHATKIDEKELVHRLVLWTIAMDENGRWMYEIDSVNKIHFSLLTNYVARELAKKAALLPIEKRKSLISELKGDGAASAYRGVIFEADAIDRLVRGGTFTLRKCSNVDQRAIQFDLNNSHETFPLKDLDSFNVEDAYGRIVVPDARNFESAYHFRVSSPPVFHTDTSVRADARRRRAVHLQQHEVLHFQMTVGKGHPTKYNGVNAIMEKIREGLDGDTSCAVVFVVPDDVQTCYKSPQTVINKDGTVRKRNERDFNADNQYYLVFDYT